MKQALLLLLIAACGGAPKPAPVVAEPTANGNPDGDAEAPPPEEDDVEIVSTRGKIDPDRLTSALQPHAGALEACYSENVGRRRWLGGGIELRWDVDADGNMTSVRLVQSDLGAWTVEKCVLDIARSLSLGKPRGGKAHITNRFDFSNGAGAIPWSEEQTAAAVNGKLKDLTACAKGKADPTNVTVTMYVGTRGKVQSVGFASPTGFDDAWADCVAGRAMAWALTDPRGKVAKASFVYNPAAIEEEPEDGGEF